MHFSFFFFFFNDTATTEIYTLSLHDALPISTRWLARASLISGLPRTMARGCRRSLRPRAIRSEEHTSELQSLAYLVCRLLLEKKKHVTHLSCDTSHPILCRMPLLRLALSRHV